MAAPTPSLPPLAEPADQPSPSLDPDSQAFQMVFGGCRVEWPEMLAPRLTEEQYQSPVETRLIVRPEFASEMTRFAASMRLACELVVPANRRS